MFRKKSALEKAEEILVERRQELAALRQELDEARASQAEHEAAAEADMHDTPFVRLSAEAEAREASALSARRHRRVARELEARIVAAEDAVDAAERAHVALLVQDAQRAIDEHEREAALAMERAVASMEAAEEAYAAVAEPARRCGVALPRASLEAQVMRILQAALLRYARRYSHLRGQAPEGVTILQNTSAGIRPAPDPEIYVKSPYA